MEAVSTKSKVWVLVIFAIVATSIVLGVVFGLKNNEENSVNLSQPNFNPTNSKTQHLMLKT